MLDLYWLAGVFVIIISVSFGTSIVFYNAYLPLIIEGHSEVLDFKATNPSADLDEVSQKMDQVGNDVSTRGFALGYVSGILVLAVSALIVLFGTPSIAL
jgi:UMF1 family MFS transporter